RTDLPDQIAAVHAMVRADRAFARVVRKAALLRAAVQREHGVGRQRTEAQRRDVQDAGVVRLRAAGTYVETKIGRRDLGRHDRMVDPLVARSVLVELRPEGPLVGFALGALVDERALLARERRMVVVALDEVLANLGPDELEQKAQMADD